MDGFPQLALGVLGTLALGLFLVLCSASALEVWHGMHRHLLPSAALETGPTSAGAVPAASSYWSGRG